MNLRIHKCLFIIVFNSLKIEFVRRVGECFIYIYVVLIEDVCSREMSLIWKDFEINDRIEEDHL